VNLADEIERAYQVLSIYGVPRERARSVPNGIEVLATRMRRAIRDVADTERAGLIKAIRILESLPEGKQHRDHGIEAITEAMEVVDPVVLATHDETGQTWEGPRSMIPKRYHEVKFGV
jgi:hypothetical protein